MATTSTQAPQWTSYSVLTLLRAHAAPLRRLGARRLGLFGSYRRGTATADSDIDLVVALERPSFDSYMAVRMYLEALFERRIDLVLESSLMPGLRDIIAHAYFGIEPAIIWDVLQNNLPLLREQLIRILRDQA